MTAKRKFPRLGLPGRLGTAADAAIFETTVVPGYSALFSAPLIEQIAAGRDARVCHVQCRTGHPDDALFDKLPNAHVYGCDASPFAIELARAKAIAHPEGLTDYAVVDELALPFPPGVFSHALTVHPWVEAARRPEFFAELARIVAPNGQVLVALALDGSFVELIDLLRECALRTESSALAAAVEAAVQGYPDPSLAVAELAQAGFEHVGSDERTFTLTFESGRAFFDDPVARLIIVPELAAHLGISDAEPTFAYVRSAIDTYWSESAFELTVRVGVLTGRRGASGS